MDLIKYIKIHIFAVSISILGFLSAIVTLFINITQLISVKWLIFLLFIALVVIVTLIGFIIDFLKATNKGYNINQLKLKDLNKSTSKGEVFLNKSKIDFDYGDVVKIYYLDKDKIEKFIGIGIIEHIQKEQHICHINFLSKNKIDDKINEVYFSLKINKDELKLLIEKD
jgi:hypothetical protein